MKKTGLVLLLILVSLSLAAETLVVEYLEGDIFLLPGDDYIDIGDELDSGDRIELGEDCMIEFTTSNGTVVLSQPGIYSLEVLVSKKSVKNKSNAWDKFKSGMYTLAFNDDYSYSDDIAGVRGAAVEQIEDDALGWADDAAPETLIADGIDSLEMEDWEYAVSSFEEATYYAEGELLEEASYYQAWSLSQMDKNPEALKVLAGADIGKKSVFYSDYILLKGSLLLSVYAAEDAAKLMDSEGLNLKTSEQKAQALLIAAIAYDMLNETGPRDKRLNDLKSRYGNSIAAGTAKAMFKTF